MIRKLKVRYSTIQVSSLEGDTLGGCKAGLVDHRLAQQKSHYYMYSTFYLLLLVYYEPTTAPDGTRWHFVAPMSYKAKRFMAEGTRY